MSKPLIQLVKPPKILFTNFDKDLLKRVYTDINLYLMNQGYKDVELFLLYDHIALQIRNKPKALNEKAYMHNSRSIKQSTSLGERSIEEPMNTASVKEQSENILEELRNLIPKYITEAFNNSVTAF